MANLSDLATTEGKSYSSSHSSCYGYIVEWRLKPESVVLRTLLPYNDVQEDWHQGPYTIDTIGRITDTEADKLVRPYIPRYDGDISKHGVVGKSVAEAIVACLKTSIRESMLNHIEWRLVKVHVETTHKVTEASNGQS